MGKLCYICGAELSDLELRFNAGQNIKQPYCLKCMCKGTEYSVDYLTKHAEDYLSQKPCHGKNNLYYSWINKQ